MSRPWRVPRGNLARGLQVFFLKKKGGKGRGKRTPQLSASSMDPAMYESSHVETDQCTPAKATHLTKVSQRNLHSCVRYGVAFAPLVVCASNLWSWTQCSFFPASNCQRDVSAALFFIAIAGSQFRAVTRFRVFLVLSGNSTNGCGGWEEEQWLEEPWDLAAGGSSRRIGIARARDELSLNTREQTYTEGVIITLNRGVSAPCERSFLGTPLQKIECVRPDKYDRGCLADK